MLRCTSLQTYLCAIGTPIEVYTYMSVIYIFISVCIHQVRCIIPVVQGKRVTGNQNNCTKISVIDVGFRNRNPAHLFGKKCSTPILSQVRLYENFHCLNFIRYTQLTCPNHNLQS